MSYIKNNLNAKFAAIDGEINTDASETQPNQGYTVKQLIYRQTKGLPVSAYVRNDVRDENDTEPVFETLDLIDKNAYAERYNALQQEMNEKKQLRKEEAEKRLKEAKDLEMEVRQYLRDKKEGKIILPDDPQH